MIKLGCEESIPQGWRWVRAQDCMDVRDGTHDSPKSVSDGIPLVTSKNLVGGSIDFSTCSLISYEDHAAISKRSGVDDGDILYAMIGTIGNPVIVEKSQDFSIKNVALFKFPNKAVNNRFIYHFLNSPLATRQFESNSRGGTQKFVSLGNIRSLEIPLPPLTEQKRIAAILDKADAIRRKRQQAIQLADEFLRSVFLDMFGDPVTNPKGWEVKKMCDVIEFKGGHQPPKDTFKYEETTGYIRLVQIRDFKTDKFKTYIPERLAKRRFEKDDVMIARYGPPVFQILRGLSGSYNVALMKAIPKGGITKEFIFRLLQLPAYHDTVVANSERTAGQTGVNLDLLNNLDVPLPPLDFQDRIISRVKKLEAALERMKLKESETDNLFYSLSQRAFVGDL